MKQVFIDREYINLAQFLKLVNIIESGGQAKSFLAYHTVLVNDIEEQRRGAKLYNGYHISIEDYGLFIIVHETF
ncbi:MAG: S4 domain-containing protein YaaA [Bacilli bacterium]